jgi:hypothetical membrane protein
MRALSACGAVAGPLFVIAFLVEGATRPGYDPLRHPISVLALGPHGWIQTASFIVSGLLTLAFVAGLLRLPRVRQKVGAVLVGLWGVGLLGAGAFAADPVSGYPPGTPAFPEELSATGALHSLSAVLAFAGLVAACFTLATGAGRRWAAYSVLTAVAVLATFVVAGAGFTQTEGLVEVAGLWQRVSVILAWAWIAVLAARTPPPVPVPSPVVAG